MAQFLSKPGCSLFDAAQDDLNLPVRETPEAPWDPVGDWVAPQRFGAVADDGQDDSDAIQQAIDSGATTVYLPRGSYQIGKTIALRGSLRRLLGCKAWLIAADPLRGQQAPLFRLEDGKQSTVWMEWIDTDYSAGPYWFMEHASARTLVMQRLAINFQGATTPLLERHDRLGGSGERGRQPRHGRRASHRTHQASRLHPPWL